jgi:molybdopterin molybdotransferase
LRLPGETLGPGQIIASNTFGVGALARGAGAEVFDLGIAEDRMEALDAALDSAIAHDADVLVTIGGASVGDHDLVQKALTARGMALDFWKIAMRPGKPLMSGRLGNMRVLGLPGNPASSLVCAHLFLEPLIAALPGCRIRHGSKPQSLAGNLP